MSRRYDTKHCSASAAPADVSSFQPTTLVIQALVRMEQPAPPGLEAASLAFVPLVSEAIGVNKVHFGVFVKFLVFQKNIRNFVSD